MNKASKTFFKSCDVKQVKNCATWQSVDDDRFTRVIATLGRECREWTEKVVNLEIDSLVEKK